MGIRLDGGPAYSGAIVTPHYDSLLVKCICKDRNFHLARTKMLRALSEFRVRGVKNNVQWLSKLLKHPAFEQGGVIWTTFIDDTPELFSRYESERLQSQRILRYLGALAVNGPQVVGQRGYPTIKHEISVPTLPGLSREQTLVPAVKGWREVLLREGPDGFCKAVRAHTGTLITDTTW
jgi:pyruvate carboxylase